ncbi:MULTISPECIES: NUDIX domain-containing protein [unclassified Salipiger]|uniref:NUDIX domain-containing protein n=1 Tax=unclassified Salipiger TaxID=2640570 RepID=UPI0013B687CB|nr:MULTISPECIES: NUDIX domain-containing protein [unclassified Salipiger]NDV51820.1 NUDIX domain-containing protein [Salipiger sp. PrR003]NDW31899.1 NUDIX domain-containing protein [Salipiger sp. PrR007]
MKVFLSGVLADPALLEIVLGRPVETPATRLPGHAVLDPEGGADRLTLLCAAPGSEAAGLLPELTEGDVARLCYFTGWYAEDLAEIAIPGEAEAVYARIDPASGGSPWDAARWRAQNATLGCEIAREIMLGYGRRPAEMVRRIRPYLAARAWSRALAARETPCTLRSDRTREGAVRILSDRRAHDGFFGMRDFTLQHERFDGAMSEVIHREGFVAYDAALVLPYDPERDLVLLIEQMRYGPLLREDRHPWVLEPVAGLVDAGESPEDCARREAVEEAGLRLGRLEPMLRVYASPGYTSEFFHCFLGLCDLGDHNGGINGLDSENEDIRSHVLPFEAAMDLVESGEVNAGPLAMMLLWLARARERLRSAA